MTRSSEHHRRVTIYAARGEARISAIEIVPSPPRRFLSAEAVPLRDIMSRELICARPDLEIATVVALMSRTRIGCLPVIDAAGRPIGMLTKLDVIEQVDAAMRTRAHGIVLPSMLLPTTAEDTMMPLALVLDEHATVAHAASMMVTEDTHHVLVVDRDGALVGVVSSKDLVRWVVDNEGLFGARDEVGDPERPLGLLDDRAPRA